VVVVAVVVVAAAAAAVVVVVVVVVQRVQLGYVAGVQVYRPLALDFCDIACTIGYICT